MKSTVLLCSLFLLCCAVYASAPDTLWTRTYGNEYYGDATSVYETSDGGFILAGIMTVESESQPSLYLVRINANGDLLWLKTPGIYSYGGTSFVHMRSDGNIVLICNAYLSEYYSGIAFVLFDSDGDTISTQRFTSVDGPWLSAAKATADGGYIITGEVGVPCMTTDIVVIRTDNSGNQQWSVQYGYGHNYDEAECIVEMPDHSFLIAGTSTMDYQPYLKYMHMRLFSAAGDSLWSHEYYETSRYDLHAAMLSSSGKYVIVGDSMSTHACMIQLETNGQFDWWRTYCETNESYSVNWLHEASGGDFVWAGTVKSASDTAYNMGLTRCAPNGDILWSQSYGGIYSAYCSAAGQTQDKGYILLGRTRDPQSPQNWKMYVVRTRPDYTAINDPFTLQPSSFSLSCFPNPFNPTTTISFTLPQASKVKINVYDMLGRDKACLVRGMYAAGEHHVSLDGSALSSGVYFARLESGGLARTQKLLLIK
jgi:hypothetical protein